MSWLFSQALVAEYSDQCCSDIEQSALLNTTPTPDQFYWPDKTTEHSRLSRFGMTCVPLTENLGEELLRLCLADFLARTYQLPETGPDWTAKGQGYGQKWQGSFGKYDPVTHSLKTAQLSLLEDLTGCCPTLPRWGLMLDGELFPQPMLEPRTGEKESGYWQALVADDSVDRKAGKWNSRGEPKLSAEVLIWPTPTVCGNYNRPGVSVTSGMGLASAVRLWTTATATAYKGWSPNHNRANTDDRLDYSVERESFQHGQQTPPMRLNPDWVEWLMGWPIGHTALKPLAMDRFREWQQQHSPCCLDDKGTS